MPNWCDNYITITDCSPEVLSEIEEFVKSEDEVFSFNEVIPIPENPSTGNWCSMNWGTKWESSESELNDNCFSFQTAWGPSLLVTIKLSTLFENVTFRHSYYESGCAFAGLGLYRNGETLDLKELNSISENWYEFLFEEELDDPANYFKVDGKYYPEHSFSYIGDYCIHADIIYGGGGCEICIRIDPETREEIPLTFISYDKPKLLLAEKNVFIHLEYDTVI